MLALIFSSLFVIAFAYFCAEDDAHQIENKEKIDHIMQWLFRTLVVSFWLMFFGKIWWAFGMAGLFNVFFRYWLNERRGRDARYISPSNWYDWAIIAASWPGWTISFWERKTANRLWAANYTLSIRHDEEEGTRAEWADNVHLCGTVAYALEAGVVVATFIAQLM
jgi:hypothetical protein